ncbi:DUF2189 domain-containing protein [Propionivibrio dicarboxylicus]|uniref:Uncharacterized membrane protein n=1 Tax=Propionivibrio dicarboxylicus TaxID=83767 RepID=A0A1G8K783_9RHOO|nr:DUF2189 domain-containing protein [Propionivibrio dicarboxylicus]SDI39346.1 Uncharacterized membrane protein [Propionivibrio dicarboxylicus]
MSHSANEVTIVKIPVSILPQVVRRGWAMFVRTRPLSVSFSMIFALIGVAILASIMRASYAPFIFPVSGGFMLLGPCLLGGFFAIADKVSIGQACSAADIRHGFSRTNFGISLIALLCTILFVFWVINAAYQYGSIIGRVPEPIFNLIAPSANVLAFLMWSFVVGALLAFGVFAVSAFSVPLLYYRRAGLLRAVSLSVTAVFRNFVPCLLWSAVLTISIVISIVIFPLFLVAFPVLAYASHSLYREVFPS